MILGDGSSAVVISGRQITWFRHNRLDLRPRQFGHIRRRLNMPII